MKMLLTGSKGLFGVNFLAISSTKHNILAVYYSNDNRLNFKNVEFIKSDIRDTLSFKKVILTYSPELIIHAASQGNVDFCEKNKEEAYEINVKATENIARVCKDQGIKLLYLSTNAIYNGDKPPYSEISKPAPINYYGHTKLEGERKIRLINPDFMILRLMTMYGWNEKSERMNPATMIIEKLKKHEKVNVVNDIFNNHLYVYSTCTIVEKLISRWYSRETFNIAGKDCLSRYDFALNVAQTFKFNTDNINPVRSIHFDELAPRPKNTFFDTKKIEKYTKCKIWSTREGLEHMKKHMKYEEI